MTQIIIACVYYAYDKDNRNIKTIFLTVNHSILFLLVKILTPPEMLGSVSLQLETRKQVYKTNPSDLLYS